MKIFSLFREYDAACIVEDWQKGNPRIQADFFYNPYDTLVRSVMNILVNCYCDRGTPDNLATLIMLRRRKLNMIDRKETFMRRVLGKLVSD